MRRTEYIVYSLCLFGGESSQVVHSCWVRWWNRGLAGEIRGSQTDRKLWSVSCLSCGLDYYLVCFWRVVGHQPVNSFSSQRCEQVWSVSVFHQCIEKKLMIDIMRRSNKWLSFVLWFSFFVFFVREGCSFWRASWRDT